MGIQLTMAVLAIMQTSLTYMTQRAQTLKPIKHWLLHIGIKSSRARLIWSQINTSLKHLGVALRM